MSVFRPLALLWLGSWLLLGGSLAGPANPASPDRATPLRERARPNPPPDENLGEVPEPGTWVGGSAALALTVYLFLRRARAWDAARAAKGG